MPEGHTLHRLARRHRELFVGAPVEVTSPQGRFAAEASRLDGRVLVAAEAHGKHLLHRYEAAPVVHIHLGLYGTFTEGARPAPEPVGQVRLRLVGGDHWTDLRGPNTCRLLDDHEVDALVDRLGPDPLRPDADPERAWARMSRSGRSVAALLLDQSVLAGAGNVYRAEVLFRHGVDPMTPGRLIDRELWEALWKDLVDLMADGVRTGRIDTVAEEHEPHRMGRPPRQDRHGGEVYVYRRDGQPCLVCGVEVRMRDLGGRKLYWCPSCQPER
ncbi:Fpg/Nei family DNA glycosylase [Actinoalloteichus caeruleus]|uniref:Fpg/Nei family DNA glycosylase n=1 Tax=Actinoalloteichus cyanogriseus TaxID=2893586 RepID=UPI0004BFD8E7|nr:DNA-formamidopyrimidine glycosylase family protein [Actinoalloteichus caeruleus]